MRRVRVLIILFMFSGNLFAQDLMFEHFSSTDGLSNNIVRGIIQDDEGYLWFATSGGLNRFDGHYFDVYKPSLGDTLSLSESRLYELFVDVKGFVWALSSLGNAHRINSKKKEVLNLKESGLIPEGTSVRRHLVSENGDIWLLLDYGLVRLYYPQDTDEIKAQYLSTENLLPGNVVNFVFPFSSKVTWIGTNNGLVKLYLPGRDSSITSFKQYYANDGIEFLTAHSLNNKIYFGTSSQRILEFDPERSPAFGSFTEISKLNNLLRGNITAMNHNRNGDLLFGTNTGDLILQTNNSDDYYYFESGKEKALDANYISEIHPDSYGVFWLVTEKRGVYKFNPETKTFKYFGLNFENRTFLGEPDKQLLLEDSNRNLWIGINGGGLFKYQRETEEFQQYNHDPNNFNTISSDVILSLFEDRSKNLWIGTSYGGINKVSLRKNQFQQIKPVENPETGFDNYIRSVVTDPLGNFYIGSKAGKIFVYRGQKKIGTIPDDLYNPDLFPATNIYCMSFDQDHNLWVGTKGYGIFVFKSFLGYFSNIKHQNIEVVHITRDVDSDNTLTTNNIYSIEQDIHGQYWIANFNGGLDLLIDPFENPQYTNFTVNNEATKGIVSPEVRNLYLDNAHNLWIATSDGISILESNYLNAKEKRFINLKPSLNDTTNLSGKVVYQVMQAQNNDIYAVMLNGGINQLKASDFKSRKFSWIHHSPPLLSTDVFCVEEDNNGNIWMGTDNGLFKLNPETEAVEKYRIRNSYLPLTFSESSSARTNRYELIFGSEDGFIYFHPDSIYKDSSQYPIRFSRLEINGEHITNLNSSVLTNSIEDQQVIELSHDQNNITLYFSILDYDKPDAIQYSYFLKGYDSYWSKASNSYYANYRKLAPGNYTLYVKGTNSSGTMMKDMASIDIVINPSFWRSGKGQLLIFIITVLIITFALIVVYRQIFIQNKLKVENAITEKRIEYYTNISHEFKTPLSLILNPVEEIINSHKSSDFAKEKAFQIRKNATYLKRLIEQILDFRKLREGKMQLKVAQVNLVELFREIYLLFLPLANKMNIQLNYECNKDEFIGFADIRQLEKICFNLLSNALRFTPAGKTVHFELNINDVEKKINIRVEDQGPGIKEEDLPRIFDRFSISKSSTGIGLFFTKELVLLHKGQIDVENKKKGGAVFNIVLPVGRTSYTEEELDRSRELTAAFDLNTIEDIESIITGHENQEQEHQHMAGHLPTILVVEDNEEMRKYLASELSKRFSVLKAYDGRQGLEMVEANLPDLVLSDVKMPEMDGFELTRAIKENFNTSHIPVILLTAEASEENMLKGTESGADDYIVKPFKLNYLLTKIEKTILQRKKLKSRYDRDQTRETSEEIKKETGESEFISEVQKLITENLANQKLNVEFLVEKMGISRTLFFKKIKSSSGFSPNEYIRMARMKDAARKLKSTDMTVNEIGYSVGFNDSNYFGKSFKKHFGMTPSEYRATNARKSII